MDNKQITTYPHFAPNQVLTDKQLNGLHAFLDGQNRLTRTHGIGAGVVCGLWAKYRYESECHGHYIDIAPGYGFSSNGYYIEVAAKEAEVAPVATAAAAEKGTAKQPCGTPTYTNGRTYTHVRPYYLPQQDPFGDPADYKAWAKTKPATASDTPKLWELLTAEEAITATHAHPLGATIVSGRVLVLYLEQSGREDKPCVNLDCKNDEQVVYTVRALLVGKADFVLAEECEGIQDKLLYLPRFFTEAPVPESDKLQKRKAQVAKAVASLTNIQTYDDINAAYGALVENIVVKLTPKLESSFRKYDTFLNLACEVDIKVLLDRLSEIIKKDRFDMDYHQYHYDFVRDLVYAYNEFLTEACKLTGSCWPVDRFPRHLGIAHLLSDGTQNVKVTTHGYRHSFKASAVRNVMHGDWGRVRKMFLRIRDLIQHYAFDTEFKALVTGEAGKLSIFITPSQTEVYPLGRRAIPYYYYYDVKDSEALKAFEHNWQPAECCTGEVLLGYAYQKGDGNTVQEVPLEYNLLNHSFLRIEGHIGKRLIKGTEASKTISDEIKSLIDLRKHNNLGFDLVLVNLAKDSTQKGGPLLLDTPPEGAFLVEDPDFFNKIQSEYDWAIGLEHSGGVTHGGTFIIVFDYVCVDSDPNRHETIAVADFSLHKSIACCLGNQPVAKIKSESVPLFVATDFTQEAIIIEPVVASKSRSLDPNLATRAAAYREKLFALNIKGEFVSSSAYTAALDFVGANVGFNEALPHYRDTCNKLMLAFARSKDNKKQAIREMIEQTTLRLLDLASQEQTISTETFAVIAGQIEKIKPSGLTSSRIRTNWKGSDLGNSATLTALNQLLK